MTELGSHAPLAFAAGLLSVLSPCVLPLMPAYLSLVSGVTVEEMRAGSGDRFLRRRVMAASVGFVLGFSVVFVLMGVGAVSVGRVLRGWEFAIGDFRLGFAQLMGFVVILFGLHMARLTPIRMLYRDTRPRVAVERHNAASAFLVGAAFALGWSPCIGPILATILGLAAVRESALEGAALLSIYSAGLAVPFLLAGWSVEFFFRTFSRIKHHFRKLELASGMILVAVGALLVSGQLSWLNARFSFVGEWIIRAERALQ